MMESYRHIIIHYNNPYVNISVALYDDRLKKIFTPIFYLMKFQAYAKRRND